MLLLIVSGTGAVTYTATAAVSIAATVAATANVAHPVAGSLAATVTIAAASHVAHPVAGAVAATLTVGASVHSAFARAASVSVTTTVTASLQSAFVKSAAINVTATVAGSTHVTHVSGTMASLATTITLGAAATKVAPRSATVAIGVRVQARVKSTATGGEATYVGRLQQGQTFPLWETTRDRLDAPTLPTIAPPVASVYNLDLGKHVEDVVVPWAHEPSSPTQFAGPLDLGVAYPPGRYVIVYRWSIGARLKLQELAFFEIQAGGDAAGLVIAGTVLGYSEGQVLAGQVGGRIMAAIDPTPDDGGV